LPKKVDPNEPAPEIETPSMPAISGLGRPSRVGPWLLKNSIVELEVSRQDALGLVPKKLPAALADAEQIAPTEMTLTGEPPASPCAETLRVAVL
jgi:hypothetical protein